MIPIIIPFQKGQALECYFSNFSQTLGSNNFLDLLLLKTISGVQMFEFKVTVLPVGIKHLAETVLSSCDCRPTQHLRKRSVVLGM